MEHGHTRRSGAGRSSGRCHSARAGTADPTALARYEQRQADNITLVAVTDALNQLFSNDNAPVRAARNAD